MEKNIVINFIFYILFIKAKLDNYLSLKFHMVDDCIRNIDLSGTTIFDFTPEDISKCDFAYQNIYPEFFTKNLKYEYGNLITFKFQDSCHFEGFMNISVYFNEYIITIHDQRFWKCLDCISDDKNYVYENGRLNFYSGKGNGETNEKIYTFIFQINKIQDLYNGGEKGLFKVNNEYYDFNDKKISQEDYVQKLMDFSIPVNSMYFILGQGGVDSLFSSKRNKIEQIIEVLSGSYKYKERYDTLVKNLEEKNNE